MERRGIDYDVGRVLECTLTRPVFNLEIVHRELEIIKNDLRCNSVRICGESLDRLIPTAEYALAQGLEVLLSPELFEKSMPETLDYLAKAAAEAELLRLRYPKLIFSVGSELSIFMKGILEGDSLMDRISRPSFTEIVMAGKHNVVLNDFLAKANKAVRAVFHGPVTYVSVPLETVDWSLFDFVAVDLYREARIRDSFEGIVRRYLGFGKPILIGETGCCTYTGAEDAWAWGWAIVELTDGEQRVKEGYVRDEGTQAREVGEVLRIFDSLGINGVYVFTFIAPYLPFDDNPSYDLDMAGYGLVRYYKDHNGTVYPDMAWDPKEAFKTVSDYYARF